MDSLDLLAREDEFKKLNKQLEKRTASLIKEIEHVMQKQDIFSEFTHNINTNRNQNYQKYHCKPPEITTLEKIVQTTPQNLYKNKNKNSATNKQNLNLELNSNQSEVSVFENGTFNELENCSSSAQNCTNRVVCDCCLNKNDRIRDDLEFLYAFVSVNVKDAVLPQSFLKDRVTVESVCKFLSSKVKLMQEQIDKLQATLNKKAAQCEKHLSAHAELESERLSLLNRANNSRTEAADVRAKYIALQKKYEEKDRLYKQQRSEADKLTAEAKTLRNKNVTLEARCASQEENIITLKQQVEASKRSEKEFRESSRNLSASHQSVISHLEQQIKTLTTLVDKQNELMGNLKKQNFLLSMEGAVRALERDYNDFLNQDFD